MTGASIVDRGASGNAIEAMDPDAVICCRGDMSGRPDLLVRLVALAVIVADLAGCASDTVQGGCPPCPTGTICWRTTAC